MKLLEYHLASGIRAFSTMREGGFSQGSYAEFNANAFCGDDPVAVAKNRQLLADELHIERENLVFTHQIHSTFIRTINSNFMQLNYAERASMLEGIDGLCTDRPGVCLCISTADCIPIVICDPVHRAIAVAHAGWRGTMQRIAEITVEKMVRLYATNPADCRAAIGPGISLQNFEVGDEVYDAFARAGFQMETIARRFPVRNTRQNIISSYSSSAPLIINSQLDLASISSGDDMPTPEKWHIDLPLCNRQQLIQSGLQSENIHLSGICTYQQHDQFFSARRLGVKSGRIITGVMIEN